MKLRIHENSLRLRLSQSEVAQFSKTGFVEDCINFAPGSNFAYTLESSSSIPSAQASYQNGWFRIQVPAVAATEWFSTDRVSLSGEQPLPSGKQLTILVEKDFQCLHGPEQRDPDAYPNPLEETAPRG